MSSILKALRKIEDEKSALGEGNVDLAHSILKQSYSDRQAFPLIGILAGVLVLLLISGGSWFLFSSSHSESKRVQEHLVAENQGLSMQPEVTRLSVESLPEAKTLPMPSVGKAFEEIPPRQIVDSPVESMPIVIPALRISEIVYRESSDARMAVINDLPVMEGTDIEGARIERIYTDRVQFLFQGVRFSKYRSIPD